MRDSYDVVVIGAGAAGLTAAVTLMQAPLEVLVIEARDRIGGRGHTVTSPDGLALDLGCGWLHSADVNPYSRLAGRLGFDLDKTEPPWMRQACGLGMDAGDQRAFGEALAALERRIEAANAQGGDRPVSDLFDPDCPWNPLLDAFSAYYNGDVFERISALDYGRFEDTDVNWRTPQGYGALVVAGGAGVPVLLETEARRIDHGGRELLVETSRGSLRAASVIVTVPTPLLATGALAFSPALPEVTAAAEGLSLGLADKLFLALDRAETLPVESHLFGASHRTATGSYHLRPFGRPLIEAFFGGGHAWALEAAGPGAAAAFAIDELVGLLGSDYRARLRPIAGSAWGADPFARGSYSHAAPGCADAREVLARPIDDRIYFAGEAASVSSFSTVHGAAASGAAAARAILARLGLDA